MKKHIELINKINFIGLDPALPNKLGGNEMDLYQFVFQLKSAIVEMHNEIGTLRGRIDELEFKLANHNGLVEPD